MYRIEGLSPEPFEALFALSDHELAARGMVRMIVTQKPGFPCRISLVDREPGERVILLNHVSHDVANPYRATHAIFVGEAAEQCEFVGRVPPALDARVLSLRAFGPEGMMVDAALVQPGEADAAIRRLFGNHQATYIHAHNAARGCFAARVERA